MNLLRTPAGQATGQAARLVLILITVPLILLTCAYWEAIAGIIVQTIQKGRFYTNTDFYTMWNVGKLLQTRDAGIAYHPQLFDRWLEKRYATGPVLTNWIYPPTMGIFALLVSPMPLWFGFWLWRGATILLAAIMLRAAKLSFGVIIAGLLGPVEVQDTLLGQNGALTAGVLVTALLMIETRPRLGGLIAGLLCLKPQIGILLPAALLNRRREWVFHAAGTVLALFALSVLIEGWRSWFWFVTVAQPFAAKILATPFGQVFQMDGFTVFLAARSLKLSLEQAWWIQGSVSVLAFLGCAVLWRLRGVDNVARMSVTVCLSMLAMPYGFSYDLVGFSVAMAALALRAPIWRLPLLAVLWLWPGFLIWSTRHVGFVLTPLVALTGVAVASVQLRSRVGTAAARPVATA